MLRNRIVVWMVAVVSSLLSVAVSNAEEVTFAFTATIDRVSSQGTLPELADVGDEVSGTFSFESTSPDLRPTRSDSGAYDAIGAANVDLNGTSLSASTGRIAVFLSDSSLPDNYAVVVNLDGGLRLEFHVGARGGTGFADDSLPLTPPDLGGVFFSRQFKITGAGGIFGQVTSLTLVPPVLSVAMDVKPGSDSNPVNLRSRGRLPVAILSSVDFDARVVDETTVLFGDPQAVAEGSGIPGSPIRSTVEDVDGDGLDDLLLFFSVAQLSSDGALTPNSEFVLLSAETIDGVVIEGLDVVRIVGRTKK